MVFLFLAVVLMPLVAVAVVGGCVAELKETIHDTNRSGGQRTCIGCHKGIAHRLPDMSRVPGRN